MHGEQLHGWMKFGSQERSGFLNTRSNFPPFVLWPGRCDHADCGALALDTDDAEGFEF